MQKQNKN